MASNKILNHKNFDWLFYYFEELCIKISLKCSFCQRTFTRRSAYTQHTNRCILTAESSDELSENENSKYLKSTSENSKRVSINYEEYEEIINFEVFIIYNYNI